jgi:LuxR family maltose regulon positive regulatory protein
MDAAGLGLSPEQISVLVWETEGWVTGLRFAALALRSDDDPQGFIARFSGSEVAVAGYLTGEVMTRLPAQSVQLLGIFAVCSELAVAVAVALTGRADAGQVLDDLAHGTALAQRTNPETYRIHPILRTNWPPASKVTCPSCTAGRRGVWSCSWRAVRRLARR